MNQSSRIRAINQIAHGLAMEEWSLIDLTLRQFGLPWSEQWNGSKTDYIINMIEDASDQTLIDLAHHLGISFAEGSGGVLLAPSSAADLMREIDALKALMIEVATGGPRIQQVNDEYKERQQSITAKLAAAGLTDPNPFADLWSWYGRWSDGSLPSYRSRRSYVTTLYQPIIDRLMLVVQERDSGEIEPTGWARVDRSIDKVTRALATAQDEEDFQALGLLCRESIISLAQAVYDPARHPSQDGVSASDTDAKRMLENYIAGTLAGGGNVEFRKCAKDTFQLAVTVQHKRTATFRQAALCVEATRSLVNMVSIMSGVRDP